MKSLILLTPPGGTFLWQGPQARLSHRFSRQCMRDLYCLQSSEVTDVRRRPTCHCRPNHDIAGCIDSTRKSRIRRQPFDHDSAIRTAHRSRRMINMRSGNASRGGYRGEYRSDLLFLLQSARRHEQGRQGSMGRSEHLCHKPAGAAQSWICLQSRLLPRLRRTFSRAHGGLSSDARLGDRVMWRVYMVREENSSCPRRLTQRYSESMKSFRPR